MASGKLNKISARESHVADSSNDGLHLFLSPRRAPDLAYRFSYLGIMFALMLTYKTKSPGNPCSFAAWNGLCS